MCCYESVVNQIVKKIIAAMHQTATSGQDREWVRDAILDAAINSDEKTVTIDVATVTAQQRLTTEGSQLTEGFMIAFAQVYPGYLLTTRVKQPLDLKLLRSKIEA